MISRKHVLTPKKEQYIRDNYLKMSDLKMSKHLRTPRSTVTKWRLRLGLNKRGAGPKKTDKKITKARPQQVNLKRLSDEDRRKFFLQQLRTRPRYDLMSLTKPEMRFYEEKYVEYFSNPDIETITVHEEDDLHEMTILQIRIMRLQKEEHDSRMNSTPNMAIVDNSKQIKDAMDDFLKLKKSLDLERRQRLERQEDSATNFTTLVGEINKDHTRALVGEEATMLKFRMEESLNQLIQHERILGVEPVPLEDNFINGKLPDDYEPPNFEERLDDGEKGKEEAIEEAT
jgi:hypothetical protein